MSHVKYPKIKALHNIEVEGILDGNVYIQEKLDGANLSCWLEDGLLCVGSRTQYIVKGGKILNHFRGASEYCINHEGINRYLKDNPHKRLFGEWLVKHTIVYPEHAYQKFWMYDIAEPESYINSVGEKEYEMNYSPVDDVYKAAEEYDIPVVHLFYHGPGSEVDLHELAGKTETGGEHGEGVVIKDMSYRNQFLKHRHAKLVTEKFKEGNAIVFGGYHRGDHAMEFASKYITVARVMKIINKIEQNEDRKIQIQDTPRVMGIVYHDAFEEEIWSFCKKKTIDFKKMEHIAKQRARTIFHGILNKDPMFLDLTNDNEK